MNTKKFFLSFITSCLLLSVAFAQPKKLVADKIIAVVGDKVVLKSDIDNSILDMERQGMTIPPDGRCLTLEQAMGIKALVLQAKKIHFPLRTKKLKPISTTRSVTLPALVPTVQKKSWKKSPVKPSTS